MDLLQLHTPEPDHEAVMTADDAARVFERAWVAMHDAGVHLHARRYAYAGRSDVDGIVIVARGTAARMLDACLAEIPDYDGYYEREEEEATS